MTIRARAVYDLPGDGVKVALGGEPHEGHRVVRTWVQGQNVVVPPNEEAPAESWLRMTDEEARAVYEALAHYFGFSTVDASQLRHDYDAERRRVDKMLDALIKLT